MSDPLPVRLCLQLWSLGHSASDVGRRIGISRKRVTVIVAQARLIRDPLAVLHAAKNGRLLGRAGHRPMLAAVEVVPAIPSPLRLKAECVRGHARTPDNVTTKGECRICKRASNLALYHANKHRQRT